MAINLRRTVNKEKLKAKFEAEAQGSQGPSDFLPYFKLKANDSLVIRFLSDGNPNNQDFFTFTETVYNFNGKNMKFDGADKDCPSAKLAAELFAEAKDIGEETPEGKEVREKALKFYKKRKFLANAYIVEAPEYFWAAAGLDSEKIEDRVKVVSLPKKVYESIKDTVMDDQYNDVEFYNFGDDVVNFRLTVKKNQGGFNDYASSKFEIKPKNLAVDDEEIDAIAEQLKDLSTIFKLYSVKDFAEAIEIELNGEKDESKPKNVKHGSDDGSEEDTSTAKATVKRPTPATAPAVVKKKAEPESEPEPEDESYTKSVQAEPEAKKDIKGLRAGILSKLKVKTE